MNARAHCSFQRGTTTEYGTTWLSVASSTYETGTVVQTLDYYPYGGLRISNSTSTNEKRKFIGQFSDDTNLSYLNARYYNPNQGQFISQDPVFWEIGLTQDGKSALSNPQALNSYGYANDNPITNKDPLGRWYVQIGIDKSIDIMGYQVATGVVGIRINGQGVVTYSSAAGGAGGLINLPIQFSSGDINVFNSDVTTGHEVTYALGPSLTGSYEGKFDPSAPLKVRNGRPTFGITAGLGAWAGQTYTITTPLFNFYANRFASANTPQARNQVVQSFNAAGGATTNGAEQRDELAPFHWPMSPVLPTERIAQGVKFRIQVMSAARPLFHRKRKLRIQRSKKHRYSITSSASAVKGLS